MSQPPGRGRSASWDEIPTFAIFLEVTRFTEQTDFLKSNHTNDSPQSFTGKARDEATNDLEDGERSAHQSLNPCTQVWQCCHDDDEANDDEDNDDDDIFLFELSLQLVQTF